MKNSLLKSFFSTGLQAIALQVLGLLFFYIISVYLPKESFGIIVAANASSMMITAFLSLGMEQVATRRIAASERSDWAAAAFLFHALISSLLGFCVLLLLSRLFSDNAGLYYLPWFFVAQALLYLATPLKQYLNAKQRFGPYGVIAICSNLFKVAVGVVLLSTGHLTIVTASIVLIVSAALEFVLLAVFIKARTSFTLYFRKVAYYKLIRESFPLYVTAIFDVLLKRADVILLGVLTTGAITGDYGFAYRAFEMATLPVLMIGPIILAKLARTSATGKFDGEKIKEIGSLFTIEVFLAMFIPIILNILWSPLLNIFTKGKYGSGNATEFLILSTCVPLYFSINLLWTLSFTSRKYKKISIVTLIAAICNLILNLIFIPWLGGIGAAMAFLITTLIQTGCYYHFVVKRDIMELPITSFFFVFLFGAIAYYVGISLVSHTLLQLIIAVALYILLSVAFRQIGKQHLYTLKAYLKR